MTEPDDMKAMLKMLLDERKEAKEREERLLALLEGRSGTAVPAQNAEQLLISNLSLRIEMFHYNPEEDLDFQAWYKRHGDIFEEDGKDVSDAAKARLLVQKLGTAEHRKYLDSIKPKEPKELSFEASVKQLMSLFAPTISKVTRQYQCFHLKQSVSEDKISFASNVNSMWESCFSANVNLSTLKCVSFIAGLADSEIEARASCMRLLEKAEADNRVPTLDELKEQCKKVDVFNQGIASLSSQAQSMNINAVKAQHANRPITGKNRSGRKETINPNDLDPGQNSGKFPYNTKPMPKLSCGGCAVHHLILNCPHRNAKCFKCDQIGHLASICPSLHKSKNINLARIQVKEPGSWYSDMVPQNDGRKKANRSKLSKNSGRSAQSEPSLATRMQLEDELVDRLGCDPFHAGYALEENNWCLDKAEEMLRREKAMIQQENSIEMKQIQICSAQLVDTFSKHSSNSSHSLHSNSSLSPGISKPNTKSQSKFSLGISKPHSKHQSSLSPGISKPNTKSKTIRNSGCSNNTWQSFEPNCSKRKSFDKGARVYFQTWNPGVVISRNGNEYYVRSEEGPCISEECQLIAEDSNIALRVHQIRSRSAITAKEEQEVAVAANVNALEESAPCSHAQSAKSKVRAKRSSKFPVVYRASVEPLVSQSSPCLSLANDQKLEVLSCANSKSL